MAGEDVADAIAKGKVLASAVALVRDLVNTSPSHLFPESFAAEAGQIAAAAGLDIEVLDDVALADGAYGGITGVGPGSVPPPQLVSLTYHHPDASRTQVFPRKRIPLHPPPPSLYPPTTPPP